MSHQFKSKEEALAILAKIAQYEPEKAPCFVDKKFPEQAAFIEDDSYRVAALCSRRAGKSEGAGRKLYRACFLKPGTTAIYISLTRQTAKEIMWDPIIKKLNRQFGLDGVVNETELSISFPSVGSRIRLLGMDKDSAEMHKVLGMAPSIVIIDEAGSFRQNLRTICYEMIEPALTDYDGTLVLLGTPTDLIGTLFHDVTKDGGREPMWSVHRWNTTQNIYIAEKWEKRLELLMATNPRIKETPAYQRMYLGKWVEDIEKLVYKYSEVRNAALRLPDDDSFTYTLGIDLGFNDATAFVLGAYGEYDPNFYILKAVKEKGLIFSDVAERIHKYLKEYPIASIVIDGANKQGVEEMRRRHRIPFLIAEKQGKADFINLMNSDLIQGKIKLMPDADPLVMEWRALIWDDQVKHKKAEHPSCENHCADAALYAYRHALQYLSMPKPPPRSDTEKLDEWEERECEKLNGNPDDLDDLSELRFSDGF